jgi:hypothetical protein
VRLRRGQAVATADDGQPAGRRTPVLMPDDAHPLTVGRSARRPTVTFDEQVWSLSGERGQCSLCKA